MGKGANEMSRKDEHEISPADRGAVNDGELGAPDEDAEACARRD